ncbi:MAG: RIP metalloprotease RseP [Clostridia bacterium]|nr:RIP metalloprotease RseP [Clostridia bacterium]
MNTVLTVLIAVLVFGFLIFIHELGHFLTARAFGVRVYEFSIGMGPKLLWFDSKKSGIRYQLCMFPFGGYVNFGEEGKDDADFSEDPKALSNQKPYKRFIIMAAGGVVNLLAGFILMFAVVVSSQLGSTVVAGFPEEIRHEEVCTADYGLQSGDKVVSVGGKRVHTSMELDYEILRNGITPLEVVVLRGGEYVTLEITFPTETTSGQITGTRDFSLYEEPKTFSSVMSHTFYRSICTVRMVWESLYDLITGRFGIEAVSGPVGITTTMGEAASYGFVPLLHMVAIISINLGIVNLFPLPALDGGRLVFVIIEMIRRKPISRELEAKIHGIGMLLLLLLTVFIMFKDIRALF